MGDVNMGAVATSDGSPARLRLLVIEDEALIRMLFEDMLQDLGHTIVAATGRIEEAIQLAQNTACDAAILDVHLNGVEVFPAAHVLAGRKIPFLFATGFGSPDVPEQFRNCPTLQKPFQESHLKTALAQLFSARALA
jgi:CheY-like chemotaxis protein